MKNIFIAIFSILSISLVAQEATTNEVVVENNTENSIAPKEGDFTIGLDMVPLLKIIGGDTRSIDYVNKQSFIGKYFISDDMAIRTRFQVGIQNWSESFLINDDTNTDPLSRTQTEDSQISNRGNFALAIGAEKRKSYGKLNVFYGAELVGSYGYSNETYKRGNAMTVLNPNPTSIEGNPSSRIVSSDNGTKWGIGGNAFVGLEYYFTSRLALGSEISFGYQHVNTSESSKINEYMMAGSRREETIVTSPSDVTNLTGFTNPYVSLYMMFTL